MSSFTRGVASAAVAAIASQFASAGFVYESANRTVSTSVIGQGADSDSSAVFGAWFGSASTVGSGYTVLSTQGSEPLRSAAQVRAPISRQPVGLTSLSSPIQPNQSRGSWDLVRAPLARAPLPQSRCKSLISRRASPASSLQVTSLAQEVLASLLDTATEWS